MSKGAHQDRFCRGDQGGARLRVGARETIFFGILLKDMDPRRDPRVGFFDTMDRSGEVKPRGAHTQR